MNPTATQVNYARMRELSLEVNRLLREGNWTLEAYRRINREAVAAGGSAPGARDWLLSYAQPEWRDQLGIRETL